MVTEKKKRWRKRLIIVGCIILLAIWLRPLLENPRIEPLNWQCMNNQRQIALALHNYYSTYDQFPPAYVTDKDGKPLYSWRVLILPFIEQADLYEQFHLNEPWDSPHNKKLSETEIDVFHCKVHRGPEKGRSNHVLVTGPGTIWENPKRPRSLFWASRERESQQRLMMIEVGEPGVRWAEPKDLKIDDIAPAFLNEDGTFKTSNGYWTYGSWYDNFRYGKVWSSRMIVSFYDGITMGISQEELSSMIDEILKTEQKKHKTE